MDNLTREYDDTEHDILQEALENVSDWFSYWEDNIERADRSVEFYDGLQWSEIEKEDYNNKKKNWLTYNKIRAYVKQMIGEYRQNTPDIKIRARDLNVQQNEVDNVEGLVRAISYNSDSDIVYQTALENGVVRGFGALRVYTQYEDEQSFNEEIKLDMVEDPCKIFFDPKARKPAKDDGEFCGIYTRLTKKEFEAKYPDIKYPVSFRDINRFGFEWGDKDNIIICEYFKKEWYKEKIALLNNGQVIKAEEFKNIPKKAKLEIVNTREVDNYKIMHYKLIADQIIDQTEWPCKYFPLVYVDGDSIYYQGAQYTTSVVYPAIDAQRFLNYAISETAQFLKITHRGKYLFTPDQVEAMTPRDLAAWKNPDRAAILVAKPDKKTGQMPLPMPPPSLPPDLMNIWGSADANIESILGRYGTIKGMDSNELSGVAIANKIRQGNTSVITYFDNMRRAIEHVGKIIIDLIPKIYDTQRLVQIMGADKTQKTIPINMPQMTPFGIQQSQFGQGKFDIEVTVGPNFAMQKADALQQLLTLAQANPAVANLIPDLIVANLDLENVNQIVDRVKTLVPPQILAQESGQPMPPQPQQPDPQMMLQQSEIQSRMAKAQADQMSAQAKMIDAQRRATEAGLGAQIAHTRAGAEMGKAELDYRSNLAKAIHSTKEEMLRRENEILRTELEQHRRGYFGMI